MLSGKAAWNSAEGKSRKIMEKSVINHFYLNADKKQLKLSGFSNNMGLF